MASDTVTSDLVAFLIRDYIKWERIGEAHLSYYASTYNTAETNQPPQDLRDLPTTVPDLPPPPLVGSRPMNYH